MRWLLAVVGRDKQMLLAIAYIGIGTVERRVRRAVRRPRETTTRWKVERNRWSAAQDSKEGQLVGVQGDPKAANLSACLPVPRSFALCPSERSRQSPTWRPICPNPPDEEGAPLLCFDIRLLPTDMTGSNPPVPCALYW
jgi:hypothetical protein